MVKRILVPIDFSDVDKEVIQIATAWSKRTNAEVFVFNVYSKRETEEKSRLYLENFLRSLSGDIMPKINLCKGVPYEEIIKFESVIQADLIIMAAHSHTTIGRLFMGSNTDYVVHHSKCPVYVHKKNSLKYANKIIVPLDFSDVNIPVIKLADEWAINTKASLVFLHIGNIPEFHHYNMEFNWDWDQTEIDRVMVETKNRLNQFVQSVVVKSDHECIIEYGKPYEHILDLQTRSKTKLIMMAAHSHSLLDRIMAGSNTDYLLHHAICPMYIHKARDE